MGIKVVYQPVTTEDALPDLIAPKWSATVLDTANDGTPWDVAKFEVVPNAIWNPFHYSVPLINKLFQTLEVGTNAQADTAAKQMNEYLIKQAWFAPWYEDVGFFAVDNSTSAVMQSDSYFPYLWNITPKA